MTSPAHAVEQFARPQSSYADGVFDTPDPGARLYITIFMLASKLTTPTEPAAARLADERLIKVTPAAAARIQALLARRGLPDGVLRVAVVGGGCSGLQYQMDLEPGPAPRDFLVESAGVRVAVDPKSALYVTGAELDYVEALQGGGFKVRNPNAASTCSCGESFSA